MKLIIAIFLTVFLFGCERNENKTKNHTSKKEDNQKLLVNNLLPEWMQFHNCKKENFKEVNEEFKQLTFENLNSSSELLKSFQPFFIYSPDSTYYIDMDSYSLTIEKEKEKDRDEQAVSYGGDVDTKVQLIHQDDDLVAELIFCGTDCIPEQAIWENESKFWIAGLKEDGEYYPIIWIFDINHNTIKEYASSIPTDRLPSDYNRYVRLKEIKFL